MKRREFISLVGGAVVAPAIAGRAVMSPLGQAYLRNQIAAVAAPERCRTPRADQRVARAARVLSFTTKEKNDGEK